MAELADDARHSDDTVDVKCSLVSGINEISLSITELQAGPPEHIRISGAYQDLRSISGSPEHISAMNVGYG